MIKEYGWQFLSLFILLVLAVIDIKEKKVPVWLLVMLFVTIIFPWLHKTVMDQIFGSGTAGLLALIGVVMRKKGGRAIGGADIAALAACSLGFSSSVFQYGVLITGILGAATALGIYIKNKNKAQQLPFLPFIFTGLLISQMGEVWITA